MGNDTLTVTDHRTGLTYEFSIADGTGPARDFRQRKVSGDDFGLIVYGEKPAGLAKGGRSCQN